MNFLPTGVLSCVLLGMSVLASSQSSTHNSPAKSEMSQPMHATGTFEVKVTPGASDISAFSRMSLDKQFHGALEATSKGEMISAGDPAKGSGGYVALEQVTGTLNGKKGTFILQHSGVLAGGVPQLTVTVVPGSGTGELSGLAGQMTITIAGGKHSYDFEYTLPQNK